MEQGGLTPSEGEDRRIREAVAQIEALLVPGERLEAYAVQRRLFALGHRRVAVGASSGRLLILARNLIGGFTLATSGGRTSRRRGSTWASSAPT
jgi:hypothetical protein